MPFTQTFFGAILVAVIAGVVILVVQKQVFESPPTANVRPGPTVQRPPESSATYKRAAGRLEQSRLTNNPCTLPDGRQGSTGADGEGAILGCFAPKTDITIAGWYLCGSMSQGTPFECGAGPLCYCP